MPDAAAAILELSRLDARFARLPEEYEQRRTAAHDAVARWEWYSGHAFDLRPLHDERDLHKPGRRLDERPDLEVGHHRIGFDTGGRPVVFEEYSGIPETVAALEIEEPAYCVALAYLPDEPAEFLVYVGLDELREEFPDRKSEEDGLWIGWNPADIGEDATPDMSAVEDTVRLLAQELRLADSDDPQAARGNRRSRELICGVAKDLNAFDWSTVLPVIGDFVVYATDMEQVDLERNMAACLPPARLADLRERGLL